MNSKSLTRIGMVNFINTAPLYEVWKQTVQHPEWLVVEADPAQLNRMLFTNELDMGLVSSHEYAAHPEKYMILDDISISASGPVGSVSLFSICKPAMLNGKLIVLSGQSQTSVSLVKIILEEFYHVFPDYQKGKSLEAHKDHDNASGVLAIGDEALLLAQSGKYPYRLDLGEVWYEQTALPFVFAVWAIRQEYCERHPEQVREIQRELKRCIEQGRKELGPISRKVAARVSMSPDACYKYLCGIEYDLGPQKKKSLERFIDYLIAREQTKPSAVPLKIFI
jgi:chorismate dehydratase